MKAELYGVTLEKADYDNAWRLTFGFKRKVDGKPVSKYRNSIEVADGEDADTIIKKLEELAKHIRSFCVEVK